MAQPEEMSQAHLFPIPPTVALTAPGTPMNMTAFPELEEMDYVPLLVAPSPSARPSLFPGTTMSFVFTAPPYCWLDIGTPVHLHVDASLPSFPGPCRCPRTWSPTDVRAIRGWVVAECCRTEQTVEYVVKNEDPRARAQYVNVLFGPLPGISPPPRAGSANDERIRGRSKYSTEDPERAPGPEGPAGRTKEAPTEWVWRLDWRSSGAVPNLDKEAGPRGQRPGGGAETVSQAQWPGTMTMNLELPSKRAASRVTTAQPYAMWEAYGGAVMSRAAKAQEDAIRNYGRPIVVRPSGGGDGGSA